MPGYAVRFQAHGVENGAFSSGASRPLWISCNHLQILINWAKRFMN